MLILQWMAYCVLISACVFAVAGVVDRLQRARGQGTRGVWVVALLVCAALSIAVALRPRPAVPAAPAGNLVVRGAAPTDTVVASPVDADDVVLLLWFIASASTFGLLAIGFAQLNASRRRARRAMLSGREVAITESIGRGAVAFGEPKILVPRWAIELAPAGIDLLIAHEDEHVRSHDAVVALVATLPVVLMPWNPALWWGVRRLRTAMEVDCDARVLRRGHNVKQYGELLLQIAGRGRTAGLPVLLPFFNSTHQLQHRILAMTSSHTLSRGKTALLVVAGASAIIVACETRRPEPLAPISDVVIADGKASQLKMTEEEAAARKRALAEELTAGQAGTVRLSPMNGTVLIVRDANGTVVHKGLMADAKSHMASIPTDQIERVEVIKGKAALPENAKDGVINVSLKPGSTWTSADAELLGKAMQSGDSGVARKARSQVEGNLAGVLKMRTTSDTLR
jgi:hypothetical protein